MGWRAAARDHRPAAARCILSIRTPQTRLPRCDWRLGAFAILTGSVSILSIRTCCSIANTAGFHFATIEQGGTSVYPGLAQRVTNVEVLRILLHRDPSLQFREIDGLLPRLVLGENAG